VDERQLQEIIRELLKKSASTPVATLSWKRASCSALPCR